MPSGGGVSTGFIGFGPPHSGILHPIPTRPGPGLIAGLIVGNKAALTAGDAAVQARLFRLGFNVLKLDDDDPSYSGAHLFVAAESCAGASLANKLSTIPFPVLLFEHAVTDDMDMSTVAGPSGASEDNVVVLDPSSPMAGGYTSTVAAMSPAIRIDYNSTSELASSALKIYSTEADSTQIVTYGYEAGATMLNGHVAEARRVFCGLGVEASLANLTTHGFALIDAAIGWAISAPAAATASVVVTPDPVALVTTAFAPDIGVGVVTVPDPAALVLTTFAPTVAVSANQVAVPGVASLTLATFAPVIGLTVTPAVASLTLATFAPVIKLTVVPGTAALTLATFAPTVAVSNNQTVVPGVAALTLATLAPKLNLTVTPGKASLTLNGLAPTVTATANQTAVPATAALTLTTFAPTVTGGAGLTVVPGKASLTLTSFAPTVTATANQTAIPATASLALAPLVPVVAATDHKVVIPATALLALLGLAPTVTGSVTDVRGTVGATVAVRDSAGASAVLRDTVVIAYGPASSSGAAATEGASVGASATVRDSVGADQ